MPRAARIHSASGCYHAVMRGIGKQILFEEDEDYRRFQYTLERYLREENAEVYAYCLMENHVHLLLHVDAGLDRLMKRIGTSYAYYFNEKYCRSGHLFQDRFNSEPVENEPYLLAVVRYIHNNPQKAGICRREDYPWSSWRAYTGKPDFTSTGFVLGLTGGYEGFLSLSESNEEIECLEISDRRRIPDKDALQLIRAELNVQSGTELQNMSREARDEALRRLKEEGLSVRQIERLTGINRGVVLKA